MFYTFVSSDIFFDTIAQNQLRLFYEKDHNGTREGSHITIIVHIRRNPFGSDDAMNKFYPACFCLRSWTNSQVSAFICFPPFAFEPKGITFSVSDRYLGWYRDFPANTVGQTKKYMYGLNVKRTPEYGCSFIKFSTSFEAFLLTFRENIAIVLNKKFPKLDDDHCTAEFFFQEEAK